MMRPFSLLLIALLFACSNGEDISAAEAAAEGEATGKQDSLFQELVFGSYTNAAANPGEITALELFDASVGELPGAHYEGRYSLTELSRRGSTETSTGFFNVYRYAGVRYIRFLDENADDYVTAYAKYSWSYVGDSIRIEGAGAPNSFLLDPASGMPEPAYSCNYGVEGSEFLPFDATDPYRATAAQLLAEVTLDNLSTADSVAVQIAEAAALRDGFASVEEYLENVDDNTLEVYEVSWYSVAYEWVRGFSGDNEFGYIYDAGFAGADGLVAEVSDGDIAGCHNNECSFSTSVSLPETSADLLAPALATQVGTLATPEDFSDLQEQQLRVMFTVDGWVDAGSSLDDLIGHSDDNEFLYYEVGDAAQWIRYYGGDNEVGAFFEKGTTNLVGLVGDGEISACVPAD